MNSRMSGKYFTDEVNVIDTLYSPCLKWATTYVRDAGYFSSKVYRTMSKDLLEFVLRREDNHVHLITCIDIYPSDFDAISSNNELGVEDVISQLNEMLQSETIADPVKMLAALVHSKKMTMYVSLRKADKDTPHSIDHVKTGYFTDGNDRFVAFDGSMNETYPALIRGHSIGNREHFNIWSKEEYSNNLRDWESFALPVIKRLDDDIDPKKIFPRKSGDGTIIVKIEDIKREDLPAISDDDWDPENHKKRAANRSNNLFNEFEEKIREKTITHETEEESSENVIIESQKIPPSKMIGKRPHQGRALSKWKSSGMRGILQHATGSGKTITAMAAMEEHLAGGGFVILVVPNTVLQDQWFDELNCLDVPVNLIGGDGDVKHKKQIIAELSFGSYNTPSVLLFVKNSFVQAQTIKAFTGLNKDYLSKMLFVADECHRIGEPSFSKYIENEIYFPKALGLSATPFDPPNEYWIEDDNNLATQSPEERNQQIINLVGDVVDIFSLADSLNKRYLTPYHYNLLTADMSLDEQQAYDNFRAQFMRSPNKKENSSIHNARRIVKSTDDKMQKAAELIHEKYEPGQWWLVYCATNSVLEELIVALKSRDFNDWLKFTSWDKESRNIHLDQFENNGGVLLTVKCLDEGFNIPKITHGLVLSSSTKEREFIQRRGRMLRKAPLKTKAVIYDFICMPHKTASESSMNSVLKHEISRMEDFAQLSSNHEITEIDINKIKRKIKRMIKRLR